MTKALRLPPVPPLVKIEDPLEVFEKVLHSLECRHPNKAEKDILDDLQKEYGLKGDTETWPAQLAGHGLALDKFLKFTLDRLSPFVDMFVALYDFLHKYETTLGGKSEHIVLKSDSLATDWPFDVTKLPRQVHWVEEWVKIRRHSAQVDWEAVWELLRIDNGLFYGMLDGIRVLQSLIVARREGVLSSKIRKLGDQVDAVLKQCIAAWIGRYESGSAVDSADSLRPLVMPVYVPDLYRHFVAKDHIREHSQHRHQVGVRLPDLLQRVTPEESLDGRFVDLSVDADGVVVNLDRDPSNAGAGVMGAVFFCAMWGLEDPAFSACSGLMTKFEGGQLLRGQRFDREGFDLVSRFLAVLSASVKLLPQAVDDLERRRHSVELLMLPYWKDRWHLYELWTLVLPLNMALSMGAEVTLNGLSVIPEADIRGNLWRIPTQKAKAPVAHLRGPSGELWTWFQRETKRIDHAGNMEPDVRLTLPMEPFQDVAILECKDREKMGRSKADTVAKGYLTGSDATAVWVVNYNRTSKTPHRWTPVEERGWGVIEGFKPGAVPTEFTHAFREHLRKHLYHKEPATRAVDAGKTFVVIDVSGSMTNAKVTLSHPLLSKGVAREQVRLWCYDIRDVDDATWTALQMGLLWINGRSSVNATALRAFLADLPEDSQVVVMTDRGGLGEILGVSEGDAKTDLHLLNIAGRVLHIVRYR